jgi:glycosyltransferase involved in cell wall biosynthesis
MEKMGRTSPRLTVGLPVFNGERYLEGAARSILDQTYTDFELVIADNASSDGTEELCRALCRGDVRVRYVRHSENIGAGPNHNFVVEQATGELFRWAGDDDLVQPTTFQRCIDLLDDKGPNAVLAFPQTEIIDERGEHVRYWAEQGAVDEGTPVKRLRALLEHPAGHLRAGFMSPLYGVVRTDALRSTRLSQLFYGSDRVLLVELALRGKLVEVAEPLYVRRQHAGQSGGWGTSTAKELDEWIYPGFRGFSMPHSRLVAGYFRAVFEAPLSRGQQLRCLGLLGRWFLRDRTPRIVLGEIRRAASPAVLQISWRNREG